MAKAFGQLVVLGFDVAVFTPAPFAALTGYEDAIQDAKERTQTSTD